jgi:hypothetical protein
LQLFYSFYSLDYLVYSHLPYAASSTCLHKYISCIINPIDILFIYTRWCLCINRHNLFCIRVLPDAMEGPSSFCINSCSNMVTAGISYSYVSPLLEYSPQTLPMRYACSITAFLHQQLLFQFDIKKIIALYM